MHKLFISDFIKNRIVQVFMLLALLIDLILSQSIVHSLMFFCLSYLTSMLLNYLMNSPSSSRPIARISKQFKPQPALHSKIKILPK